MANGEMTMAVIIRLMELIRIADDGGMYILDDLMESIYDKIECSKCPMHGNCKTEEALGSEEDLPTDTSCYGTLYDWVTSEERDIFNRPKNTVYSVEEAAKVMEVNPETVRRWIRSGYLLAMYSGSKKNGYRIRSEDLEDFALAAHKTNTKT